MPDRDPSRAQPHAAVEQPFVATFTSVFTEHYGACLRIARRMVRDEGLAHDVVQDVFLSWWRAGGYHADRGAIGPWLSTLTHHKAVDALRSADRQRRSLMAAEHTHASAPEERLVDDVVWWELGRQSLMAALPTLPPKQQEVLALAYVVGLTQAEIADRLGIPLGTVKSRTHAGLLRLRAALSGAWTPAGRSGDAASAATDRTPGVGLAVRPGTDDERRRRGEVEACARALVEMAARQPDVEGDTAAMLTRAKLLLAQHGDAAAYDLIIALAHMSVPAVPAAGSSTVLPAPEHRAASRRAAGSRTDR